MARVALAIVWLVAAANAHAAFMKGTLTLDDGRTATLTLGRFFRGGSPNIPVTAAAFRCSGDACFTPSGVIGFEPPFPGGYFLSFDAPPSGSPPYYDCSFLEVQKRPGVCRIASRIVCQAENAEPPILQVVATGMLDIHRTTPRCRRALRRAGQ